jgi:hypothetical protein
MTDAELLLRRARRPLVLGMGGGGDVVGALATAESMRLYDGADPIVGGLTWERRPIDPVPGPRGVHEIEGAELLATGVMLAGPQTRVRGSDVLFAESRMAAFLNGPTVLIDGNLGPGAIADGLCDAVMLAACEHLRVARHVVLLGIFGIGCDAELTADEVLARIADVAAAGGLCGVRGLTEPVAQRLESAIDLVPTEASAQAVRAFRGVSGPVTIRGGTRSLQLGPAAAQTFYLDVQTTVATAGRLARAVAAAGDLQAANAALRRLGVATELDAELEAGALRVAPEQQKIN